MDGIERDDDERGQTQDQLPHMSEHVVAHLVSHDHEKLFAIQLRQNRVPQHDALGRAEARDVGIDRVGVFALGDFEDAAAFDSRALGQVKDVGFERLVLHRAERVEQRIDPDRLNQ